MSVLWIFLGGLLAGAGLAVCLLVGLDSDPDDEEENLLWRWEEEENGKEKP